MVTTRSSNRRFGIEIECFGISRERAKQALMEAGISAAIVEYSHRLSQKWKVSTDGSIHWNSSEVSAENNYSSDALEVISPPLKGKRGLKTVVKVAKALEEAGAKVNQTCGFHVHVDAVGLKKTEIYNVAHRYTLFEKDIDQFMPPSRCHNEYCHSMKSLFTEKQKRNILLLKTSEKTLKESLGSVLTSLDRYFKLNLQAYVRHGTIEFRQHNGTVDGKEMVNWIKFCLNFVEQSKISLHRHRSEPEFVYNNKKQLRVGTEAWKVLEFVKMLDAATDRSVTETSLMTALNCTTLKLTAIVEKIHHHYRHTLGIGIRKSYVQIPAPPPPCPEWDYGYLANNSDFHDWIRGFSRVDTTAMYFKEYPKRKYYPLIRDSLQHKTVSRAEFAKFFNLAIPKFEGDSWKRGLDAEVQAFYEARKLEFLNAHKKVKASTSSQV